MSQTVAVLGAGSRVAQRSPDLTRLTRGYARSRVDYDRRRRRFELSPESKDYKAIVQHDPCSTPGCEGGQMAADHIVPLELGGEHSWENFTGLCRACNASKKNKPLLHWLAERKVPCTHPAA